MKQLIYDYNPYCVRVALVEDGELIEFSVERASMRGLVGNVYKGKVENLLSGMHAAFVNIGLERNGFLYVGDSLVEGGKINEGREIKSVPLSPGDVIMCQIVKDQFGTKGARLTTDVSLPGAYLVLLPHSDFIGVSRKIENDERRTYLEEFTKSIKPHNTGFIVRSAADKATDDDIKKEMNSLVELWQKVEQAYKTTPDKSLVFEEKELFHRALRDTLSEDLDAIIVNDERVAAVLRDEGADCKGVKIELYDGDENIFVRYNVAKQIDRLADRRVDMDNGAYLIVDKTEALTVIDVNTGKFVGGKNLEDTVYRTNLLAAQTIAKTLRKRNISGIVVVDFIDMEDAAHRDAVVECLKAELKKDRMRTSSVEMTALGLVELTRKKARLPVDSFLLEPCAECKGGYVLSKEHLVFKFRDALIDFTLRHSGESVFVATLNPLICAEVEETKYLSHELSSVWKNKKIYLVASDSLARDEFEFRYVQPDASLPTEAKMLV